MTTFSDKEKTRAFARKMREEGAAGFAAGPWMSWEENGHLEQAIIEGQIIPGDIHTQHKRAGKPRHREITGERFLTWVASLAVIALFAGIAGVYFAASKHEAPAQVTNVADPKASLEENSNDSWQADEEMPIIVSEKTANEGTQTPVETPAEPDAATANQTTLYDRIKSWTDTWVIPAETNSSTDLAEPVKAGDIASEISATVAKETPAALATEILAPEKPTGPWQVNIESYFVAGRAGRRLTELRELGINAEQFIVKVNGKTVYRLGIPGFTSSKTALARGKLLKQQHGLNSIWISK